MISADNQPGYWTARHAERMRLAEDERDTLIAADYAAIARRLVAGVPLGQIPEYAAERRRIATRQARPARALPELDIPMHEPIRVPRL